MKILSFGAGMQSTALALMSCENAKAGKRLHPWVPVYDAVIFCDLGLEPEWVNTQMEFTRKACEEAGIFFKVLNTPLYQHFIENFGERRTISIPWWTIRDDGHKSKMPRNCTIDYKVNAITQYVRWELLGYKKGQRLKEEDVKAHEMHMGFSKEEERRCHENPISCLPTTSLLSKWAGLGPKATGTYWSSGDWIPKPAPALSAHSTGIISTSIFGSLSLRLMTRF